MRASRTYGSMRGAPSNGRPYRNRETGNGFEASSELNRSTGTPVVQADLGIPIELSGGWSEEPSLTAQIKGRHTTAALSAVRAHRGTEGSNPFPSSGESANFRFR
jgi:hypothetical protein